MWRVNKNLTTLHVVIGAHTIVCGVMRGRGKRGVWIEGSHHEVALANQSIDAVVQALSELQALLSISIALDGLSVVIADTWLAQTTLPWSAASMDRKRAENDARAHLSAAGFAIESADVIRIDDAPFAQPRLALAYPQRLLHAVRQWAQRLNVHLNAVLPLSVAAWDWAHRWAQHGAPTPRRAWPALAVLSHGLILIARSTHSQRAHLSEVTVRTLEVAAVPLRGLPSLWQRLCLRDTLLSKIEQVGVVDLTSTSAAEPAADATQTAIAAPFVRMALTQIANPVAPALQLAAASGSERHALNAAPRTSAPTPWRWLALAAAAALASVLSLQAVRAHNVVNTLSEQWRKATSTAAAPPALPALGKEQQARVQSVNAAIRALNLPINALLRALAPPADLRIAVLSVETSTSSSAPSQSIKITAEARNSAEMTRYVAFVGERQPFTGAYLTQHEIESGALLYPYRFTVEARWSD